MKTAAKKVSSTKKISKKNISHTMYVLYDVNQGMYYDNITNKKSLQELLTEANNTFKLENFEIYEISLENFEIYEISKVFLNPKIKISLESTD